MQHDSPDRGRPLRTVAVVVISLLGHAAIASGGLIRQGSSQGTARAQVPLLQSAELGQRAADLSDFMMIAAERRTLVEKARADRSRGAVLLGEFLLAAQALDDREQHRPFDLAKARNLYASRLQELRLALDRLPMRDAIAEVFADVRYHGRPGGRIGDVLVDGGGSCEPLAQLLAAIVHDSGDPAGAALRYYGGESDLGATHLAPVYLTQGKEYDLLTGGPAFQYGVLFPALDMIEVYARAHGLSERRAELPSSAPASGRSRTMEKAPGAPAERTLARGYPPNVDRYPGTTTLFDSRAVGPPNENPAKAPSPLEARDQALDCAFFVRMAALDPPELRVADPANPLGRFSVELHRIPTRAELDRTFARIKAVEQVTGDLDTSVGPASRASLGRKAIVDRLMGVACLTALYDHAAVDFTLAGERDLAALSAAKQKKAAAEGARMLEGTDWSQREGVWLVRELAERFAGRNWLLLLLRGGDKVVLELAKNTWRDDWGRINALAALLVAPATRMTAVDIVEKLPRHEQVEVMHEIFHAHDHLRPWASNYALDRAGEGPAAVRPFSRAYRVFRGVAFGLWEGVRPPGEVLGLVAEGAQREGLDRGWQESFIDYYGHNMLNLHQNRPDYRPFTRELKTWLEQHGHSRMDLYRTRLSGAGE